MLHFNLLVIILWFLTRHNHYTILFLKTYFSLFYFFVNKAQNHILTLIWETPSFLITPSLFSVINIQFLMLNSQQTENGIKTLKIKLINVLKSDRQGINKKYCAQKSTVNQVFWYDCDHFQTLLTYPHYPVEVFYSYLIIFQTRSRGPEIFFSIF